MVTANPDDAIQLANAHLQANRFDEAERICRELLSANPRNISAWRMLGSIALDVARPEIGAQLIEQAVQYGLQDADLFGLLGQCYLRTGRTQEAHAAFNRSLQLDPNNDQAIYGKGTLLAAESKFADAVPLLAQAVTKFPHIVELQHNYAVSLSMIGKLPDAVRHWHLALHLQPNHAPSLFRLGTTLLQLKNHAEALPVFAKLIEIQPQFIDGYTAYCETLALAGKFEQAISTIKKAIEIEPNRADLYDMLGIFYSHAGKLDESIQASTHAVQLKPDFFNAIVNTGVTFRRFERFEDAIQWFERAAQLKPAELSVSQALFTCYAMIRRYDKALEVSQRSLQHHPQHAHIHFDHASALLAMGRYVEGFEEYEWRWRCKGFDATLRQLEGPKWDGISDLTGKTILLHCEQGYGDMIQFARYIPMLRQKCKQVLVGVPWDIRAVLESSFEYCFKPDSGRLEKSTATSELNQSPDSEIVDSLDKASLPPYELHFPLMSLARIFKTTVETVPKSPYLLANPARIEKWKPKVDSHARGLKVGLVWGGSPSPEPRRSCSIKALSMLSELKGISWYSLQTDEHRDQLKDAPPGMDILDLGRDFMDFGDSAAVMAQLDLLITIDTASAHLAGALGVKTWAMIIYSPDWRWGLEGDTTPWYSSIKVFRQPKLDDWHSVVSQIRDELVALTTQQ